MDINIEKCLIFMQTSAPKYAQEKAQRIWIEQFLKSKKALLMQASTQKTSAAQEVEALAHEDYISLLDGLRVAVENEERLRWELTACQAKYEVWRSLESSRRTEAKL